MWLAARELMYRRATRAISQRPEPLLPASLRSLARRPRAYVGVVSCDRSHGALAFVPGRDDSAILDPSRSRRAWVPRPCQIGGLFCGELSITPQGGYLFRQFVFRFHCMRYLPIAGPTYHLFPLVS